MSGSELMKNPGHSNRVLFSTISSFNLNLDTFIHIYIFIFNLELIFIHLVNRIGDLQELWELFISTRFYKGFGLKVRFER